MAVIPLLALVFMLASDSPPNPPGPILWIELPPAPTKQAIVVNSTEQTIGESDGDVMATPENGTEEPRPAEQKELLPEESTTQEPDTGKASAAMDKPLDSSQPAESTTPTPQ